MCTFQIICFLDENCNRELLGRVKNYELLPKAGVSGSSVKMEFELKDIKAQIPASVDNRMLRQQEENRNCTKTTTVAKTEFTINDNDDSALFTSLPKADMKIRKLDEAKLLMDNNENSLSVDTLIEILSSNDTNNKLPVMASNEHDSLVPPLSAPSTLSSPSSSSSSSKAGLSDLLASQGPSPKSTGFASPKKFPSPYHLNGGKPMISDMNKKMKQQVSKRQPRAVYRSQISDNSIGIKLCIKKSVDSLKKSLPSPNNIKSPKKRSRKPKAKGLQLESDSDDAYVKRRKKTSVNNNNNNNKAPSDEPVEQSGWGQKMPKEILFDVSCC